jgi:hypothetical protein
MPGKSSAALTTRPNQARFLASSYSLFLLIEEHPTRDSAQGSCRDRMNDGNPRNRNPH